MSEDLSKQRTYALVGHGGAGKTSVAEMILFQTGVIGRLGKIEDGTTALDYEPEEIKRRGSVQPGFARYFWQKNPHYLIDTPGDINFTGDIGYSLTAADGVVFVIDAIDGVKPLTKKMWSEVKKKNLPALVFINKMDRERADFNRAYESLKNILGIKPVLLYLPIGAESNFKGLVDVLEGKAWMFDDKGGVKEAPVPDDMADEVQSIQEVMVENIAEADEVMMEKYLSEGMLTPDEMREALTKGVLAGELVPVCAGSAMGNKGAAQLLGAIQTLLPSPLAHPAWIGEDGSERVSTPDAPAACFVFKTLADPFAGQLTIIRVLSGKINADATLVNMTNEGEEKAGQFLYMEGKKQVSSKETVLPGAIVALAKLKSTRTGDTLCDPKAKFALAKPVLPNPLISYALGAEEKGDEDKVFTAVQKLMDEDITLTLSRNDETGDMLLSGMGQLHIETAVEKARRRYKASIALKTPRIPYRETIKGKAQVQGRHKKQTGGRGQFGDCWIEMSPMPKGSGYEFEDAIVGGAIPRNYIPAVDKGVQEAAARGVLAGFPLIDFKVKLFDGSYHNVDSSEMAFKIAGSIAFKKAAELCKPILLEPIALVTVFAPDEFMGDIIGDLSSRRGKVLGSDSTAGVTEIRAHAPMAEVLKYAQDLTSMTGGQGTFTMVFDHYEECPPPIAEKVVAEHKKDAEEE